MEDVAGVGPVRNVGRRGPDKQHRRRDAGERQGESGGERAHELDDIANRVRCDAMPDESDDNPGDEPRDEIVRCVIADMPVRVVAALTTGAVREAARRHEAGTAGAIALGGA